MDDASTDRTGEILDRLVAQDPRVRACHRSRGVGGRGKSDVLNHAYRHLRAMVLARNEWLTPMSADDVCMCIVDADGHLSPTAMTDAVAMLADPHVAAVQIGVQIRNARHNLLARLQDIEFVGFSFMVQTARDRLGSVGLGGNGQFTRLAALDDLGDEPWRSQALTEDLDLGVRLQLAGWRLRFCPTAWVGQEGLTRLRPLARQRTRWTQGHYQCWRYMRRMVMAREMRIVQRVDSLAYLLLILLVVLVTAMAVIQLLAVGHVVQPSDSFLGWMGDGVAYRTTIFLVSWLPVFLLLNTYQRFAQAPLARWELPAYCVFFAAYVYIWAIATARAWTRMLLRRTAMDEDSARCRCASGGRHMSPGSTSRAIMLATSLLVAGCGDGDGRQATQPDVVRVADGSPAASCSELEAGPRPIRSRHSDRHAPPRRRRLPHLGRSAPSP